MRRVEGDISGNRPVTEYRAISKDHGARRADQRHHGIVETTAMNGRLFEGGVIGLATDVPRRFMEEMMHPQLHPYLLEEGQQQ